MLLALAAGASVVVQQGLNAQLGAALGSAAWSGVVSYAMTRCVDPQASAEEGARQGSS